MTTATLTSNDAVLELAKIAPEKNGKLKKIPVEFQDALRDTGAVYFSAVRQNTAKGNFLTLHLHLNDGKSISRELLIKDGNDWKFKLV